jgi:mono/diheme cytochrome c family protein
MKRSLHTAVSPFAILLLAGCMSQSSAPVSGFTRSESRSIVADQALQDRIMRGRQVVVSTACGDCHGGYHPGGDGWLVGAKTVNDTILAGPLKTYARNLTPHPTNGTGRYTERQIFNALRYGLKPDETPDVEITSMTPGQGNFPAQPHYLAPSMPWIVWRYLSDEDIWAVAEYLKHGLKPVDNAPPKSEAPPDFWAKVTHERLGGTPFPAAAYPTANELPGATPQMLRGRELVIMKACSGCHGGGPNPAAKGYLAGVMDSVSDEFQIGPFRTRPRNLTPDNRTGIGRFTERQIFNALRFGLRPGETPDVEITSTTPGQGNFPARPKYLAVPMPWQSWRHMPDADLWAIAAYLKKGVKPVSNLVKDSEGPPDFWASAYTVEKVGPWPALPFPTANEQVSR